MAFTKKLTDEEFIRNIINKQLEPYKLTYDDLKNLPHKPNNSDKDDKTVYYEDWFQKCEFKSFDEFISWKKYYYEQYKLWQPKRKWRRHDVERCFDWHNLSFGLKYGYDFDEHRKKNDEIDMFKIVFDKEK